MKYIISFALSALSFYCFLNYSYIGRKCILHNPNGFKQYRALIEDQLYIICEQDKETK